MAKKNFDPSSAVKGTQSWTAHEEELLPKEKNVPEKQRHNLLLVEKDFRDFQTYARARGTSANAMINEYIAQCVRENAEIIETIRKFRNGQDA